VTAQRPTRQSLAGRAYLDLQNLARRQGQPTDELHRTYALEGFLARLAQSPHASRLVLKGGVLLAAYDTRRPTRDVNMQAHDLPSEAGEILRVVCEIAGVDLADGLVYDTADASAESIRDEDEYRGVRVVLSATLAPARLSLHVEVNIGDPIWPAPRPIALPRLLGGTIQLTGYPLAMIYAEKLVTALHRGAANTRWCDFADVYLLTGRHPVAAAEVRQALSAVARYRQIELTPLADVLGGYAASAQSRWAAWRRGQRLDDRLPESFADALAEVVAFADPVLRGEVTEHNWDPAHSSWQ
jgi:Nucleotidyl transferase AbiEii toxin, Type IV TA system